MTRIELIRRFLLMEIADDYENLEHICSIVAKDSSRCGLTIPASEINQTLIDLVEAGLAKAYRLSGKGPAQVIEGVPSLVQVEDSYTHFWATPKGRELLVSDRGWWPFDDEGALRKVWVPPTS